MRKLFITLCALCVFLTGCEAQAASKEPTVQQAMSTSQSIYGSRLIVRDARIEDSTQELMEESDRLEYHQFWLNEIPVLEIYPKGKQYSSPVVLFLHGVTGSKESVAYILTQFARAGYHAISIDLPGHGQRTDGAYFFLDLILQGAKDIDTVLGYYDSIGTDLKQFAIGGFSAGAMTSLYYGTVGKYDPTVIVDISGMENWAILSNSSFLSTQYEYSSPENTGEIQEQVRETLYEENPYEHLSVLKDTTILVYHGLEDTVFPWETTKEFVEDMRALGNTTIELHLLEGVAHEFSGDELIQIVQEVKQDLPLEE